MEKIKLNNDKYKELCIVKKSEYDKIDNDYKGVALFDKSIKCAMLPCDGCVLSFENVHFIIINDNEPTKKFAIWRDHKVIGYCNITSKAAKKANCASNAEFYFGFDKVTNPEKY